MADIQLQIQDIIKHAVAVNNQLADVKTILLQAEEIYNIQIEGDIYSILEELHTIILLWQPPDTMSNDLTNE